MRSVGSGGHQVACVVTALIGSSFWFALLAWLIALVLFVPLWAWALKDRRRDGGN